VPFMVFNSSLPRYSCYGFHDGNYFIIDLRNPLKRFLTRVFHRCLSEVFTREFLMPFFLFFF
jgi:hypothetical protein